MNVERRSFELGQVTLRAGADGRMRFRGYAAVFKEPTTIRTPFSTFTEQVTPGAFTRSIEEDDIWMLIQHDPGRVLARNRSGTLRLREDRHGLAVEADLPDTTEARDLAVLLERGDISQMSFGFDALDLDDEWKPTRDGELRTLKRVRLLDVSPVVYAAYETTEATLRTAAAVVAERRSTHHAELRKRLDAAKEGWA